MPSTIVCQTGAESRSFSVLAFFVCFFLFFASGRLGSGDAYEQLRATLLLVNTGSLGVAAPPGEPDSRSFPWVLAGDGRYYEPHDIGNVVLMLPAAVIGSLLSSAPIDEKVALPSIITRVAVSLTMSGLSAIGCYFVFRLFALYHARRTAFLLGLGLPATTPFWAYAKSAFDVLGACCFVATCLYFSARVVRGDRVVRNTVFASVALALACSFRFTLAPFLLLSLCLLVLISVQTRAQCVLAGAGAFFIVMLPSFVYNTVRIGTPFLPASSSPIYTDNALTGNLVHGGLGLLFGPNRGLFLYSPVLVLALAIPVVWSRLSIGDRHLLKCFGLGSILYFVVIAKMRNWGQWGWGPRYLLPIVPIVYFAAARVSVNVWREVRWRKFLRATVALSIALSTAPAIVNWQMATATAHGASDQDAPRPYQQLAVWKGLIGAIEGKPLPVLAEFADDPIRSAGSRFPDLWTVRLMERSSVGLFAGIAIACSLALSAMALLRKILARDIAVAPGHSR